MSKEAKKLALEVLKAAYVPADLDEQRERVITAFEAELTKPDFWEGYVPEPSAGTQVSKVWWDGEKLMAKQVPLEDFYKPAQDVSLIDEGKTALDKKAENARELGLDYEPVWGGGPTNKDYEDAMRQRRLHQLTSSPAQRTWVGLTDNEIALIHADYPHPQGFARAIEAKLKEKNT
jgi:hypothetical protein